MAEKKSLSFELHEGGTHTMPAKGDHMHVEAHEDGYTTHSAHYGKMHGPHEHKTMGALKKHMGDCMDGECEV